MEKMKAQIFISHATTDDKLATYLANRLDDLGIHVWVDHKDISPGDDFVSRIEDALSNATHVLLLLSTQSVASSWVREERNIAQLFAIEGAKRLIPILAPGFSLDQIPHLLKTRVYIDLNKIDLDEAIDMILVAIGEEEKRSASASQQTSELFVESIDVLQAKNSRSRDVAIEILVMNTSNAAISIRQVGIQCSQRKHVMYFMSPPTRTYRIKVQSQGRQNRLGKMLRNFVGRFDQAARSADVEQIHGSIAEEGDDWSKAINAVLVDAPYETRLTTSFAIHLDVSPRERGRLRFVFSASPKLQRSSQGSHLDRDDFISKFTRDLEAIPRLPPGKNPTDGSTVVFLKDKNGSVSGVQTADSSLLVNIVRRSRR